MQIQLYLTHNLYQALCSRGTVLIDYTRPLVERGTQLHLPLVKPFKHITPTPWLNGSNKLQPPLVKRVKQSHPPPGGTCQPHDAYSGRRENKPLAS